MQTVKTYLFSELSPEIQEKVIEDNRDINIDNDFWHDWVLEDAEAELNKLGYDDVKIFYSGFWSQGDGACFEANADIQEWLAAHKLGNKYRALLNYVKDMGGYIAIKQSGHYYHEHSMTFTESETLYSHYYLDGDDRYNSKKIGSQIDEVMELIEAEAIEQSKAIYKQLESCYDSLITDEAIKETLLDVDNQYTASGQLIS